VDNEGWKPLLEQVVVVDTASPFIYVGTLARVEDHFLVRRQADAHDRSEGSSTKEQYVMDTKRFGVKANRKEVAIRKAVVVSISRLDDVVLY
jgi:hypothetical protein